MDPGECDCLPLVCAHMCFCLCVRELCSLSLTGSPGGMGQRISTSVRNLGPLPRGESPIAAVMLKTVMVFLTRPGGGRVQWGHWDRTPGPQDFFFQPV